MKEINKQNFQKEILEQEKPVLVEFWSSWCPPCKMMEPMLEELDQEQKDVEIRKINTDRNPEIAREYNIMGVPTFILFRRGKETKRKIAAQSKKQLKKMIQETE